MRKGGNLRKPSGRGGWEKRRTGDRRVSGRGGCSPDLFPYSWGSEVRKRRWGSTSHRTGGSLLISREGLTTVPKRKGEKGKIKNPSPKGRKGHEREGPRDKKGLRRRWGDLTITTVGRLRYFHSLHLQTQEGQGEERSKQWGWCREREPGSTSL